MGPFPTNPWDKPTAMFLAAIHHPYVSNTMERSYTNCPASTRNEASKKGTLHTCEPACPFQVVKRRNRADAIKGSTKPLKCCLQIRAIIWLTQGRNRIWRLSFSFLIPHPHMEVRASLREYHAQKYGLSQHCTGALAPLPKLKKAAVSKNSCRVWNSHCTWIPTCYPPSTPTHSLLSPATQLTTERLLHYISARTALEALLQNTALFNRAFPLCQKEHSNDVASQPNTSASEDMLTIYKLKSCN